MPIHPSKATGENILTKLQRKGALCKAAELQKPISLVSSGCEELNRMCAGGLARGHISELIVPIHGAAWMMYDLLAAGCLRNETLALVDPADGFEIESARAAGVDLNRLLWVRSPNVKQALQAVELILSCRQFDTVVLDLVLVQTTKIRTPASVWMRIKRLAAEAQSLVVVFSRQSLAGGFASVSVRASTRHRLFSDPTRPRQNARKTTLGLEIIRQKR